MAIAELTPFGMELRKIRIYRKELSIKMAERLGVTSAYISSIETGKRNIPGGFIEKVAEEYNLDEEEIKNLQMAKLKNEKKVIVPLAENYEDNKDMYDIAFFLEHSLKQLDKEKLLKIKEFFNI